MDAICLIARYAERHKWANMAVPLTECYLRTHQDFLHVDSTKCFFPSIWIDSASVRFMAWCGTNQHGFCFFIILGLSLLLSIQAFTDRKQNSKSDNQTLKFCELGCLVQLRIICKFLVTDVVLSNFVRNRLRVQGKKNGAKDRTLGNTIFQGQRRRV